MTADALSGGFSDASRQSARCFRSALEAMARPGTIQAIAGATAPGLSTAAAALLLTLCDRTTPLFLGLSLDSDALRGWIAFHTAAPLVEPGQARFALGRWGDLLPLSRFPIGLPDYPDRSATLIVEMPDLKADGARLTGPGIRRQSRLNLPDIALFQENHALFPQGLDFYFTAGERLAALPRSTIVEAA